MADEVMLIIEARITEIKEQFRREMGLLQDVPKPGSGSTNDGDIDRMLFPKCYIITTNNPSK